MLYTIKDVNNKFKEIKKYLDTKIKALKEVIEMIDAKNKELLEDLQKILAPILTQTKNLEKDWLGINNIIIGQEKIIKNHSHLQQSYETFVNRNTTYYMDVLLDIENNIQEKIKLTNYNNYCKNKSYNKHNI